MVDIPLGCGSSKLPLVSAEVSSVDTPVRLGLVAVGMLVSLAVLRFCNDL